MMQFENSVYARVASMNIGELFTPMAHHRSNFFLYSVSKGQLPALKIPGCTDLRYPRYYLWLNTPKLSLPPHANAGSGSDGQV